jgi:hypothetical protein
VTPDGRALVLAHFSLIAILDFPSGAVRHCLNTPFYQTDVWDGDLSAAGQFLATACRLEELSPLRRLGLGDGTYYAYVVLWDLRRGKRLRIYEGGASRIAPRAAGQIALRADGQTAFHTDAIRSFGMETEEELEGFTPFKSGTPAALRYSSDGRTLEALVEKRLVRLDAATGQLLAALSVPSELDWDKVALDPTGAKVAVAAGRSVEVLDLPDS